MRGHIAYASSILRLAARCARPGSLNGQQTLASRFAKQHIFARRDLLLASRNSHLTPELHTACLFAVVFRIKHEVNFRRPRPRRYNVLRPAPDRAVRHEG